MRAAVIGMFDGVHRGHRYLLDQLREVANRRGLQPLVLTFRRHPAELLCPEKAPKYLCSTEEKVKRLRADVEVLDFDEDLRKMTAEEFLAMLREKYDVEVFMIGFNNTIGHDRKGADHLAGKTVAGVEVIAACEHSALPVSSSAVRAAISHGDITAANRMLGRPYSISGEVVAGKQLGRTIGFPTANINPPAGILIPAKGVYVGRTDENIAVINVGSRPTVDSADAELTIEAYLIDFQGDLYGQFLTVEFLTRLRDEKKFSSLNELKEAIANDVKEARKYDQ